MSRLGNIAKCDYQGSVTTGQTHRRTDRQSEPYVRLCFAGNTKISYFLIFHLQVEGSKWSKAIEVFKEEFIFEWGKEGGLQIHIN